MIKIVEDSKNFDNSYSYRGYSVEYRDDGSYYIHDGEGKLVEPSGFSTDKDAEEFIRLYLSPDEEDPYEKEVERLSREKGLKFKKDPGSRTRFIEISGASYGTIKKKVGEYSDKYHVNIITGNNPIKDQSYIIVVLGQPK